MKDSYAMQLFSWQTFENLIFRKQYDAALYVLPFTYLNQAVNSPNLIPYTIKNFIFHLNNVRKSQTTDFSLHRSLKIQRCIYSSSYSSSFDALTMFGEVIFIQRCINTCFTLSIAMFVGYDIPFSRLRTHNIENNLGKIRLLSHFNFPFNNFLRRAVSANLVNQLYIALNYKLKIPKRIIESGAFVSN